MFGMQRRRRFCGTGCASTGTNLRMLAELGYHRVVGLDVSSEAIRFCAEKGLGIVHHGNVCDLPFEDASLDLVLATDIIEHVENDGLALSEMARVLVAGGSALITVPAFQPAGRGFPSPEALSLARAEERC